MHRPLAGADPGQPDGALLEEAREGRCRSGGLGLRHPRFQNSGVGAGRVPRFGRRRHVGPLEAEALERLDQALQLEPQRPRHRPRQRRVDDRQAFRAQLVPPGDLGGVDRGDPELGETLAERRGIFRAVQNQPATPLQSGGERRTDQGRVEDHDVVGLVDQIPVANRLGREAAEGLDGSTRALGGVEPERLHRVPFEKASAGDDLRQGDTTLASSPVDPDFDHWRLHQTPPRPC